MARSKPQILPVIPLGPGSVLLPGAVQRIPIPEGRPDITAIIGDAYTQAASRAPFRRIDAIPVVLVPLVSYIGTDGQHLLEDGQQGHGDGSSDADADADADAVVPSRSHLFNIGVASRIIGVEGIGTGEFALRVEAVARVRLERFTQERPFFQAKVKHLLDLGKNEEQAPLSQAVADISYRSVTRRSRAPRPIRRPQAQVSRTGGDTSTLQRHPSPDTEAGALTPDDEETGGLHTKERAEGCKHICRLHGQHS